VWIVKSESPTNVKLTLNLIRVHGPVGSQISRWSLTPLFIQNSLSLKPLHNKLTYECKSPKPLCLYLDYSQQYLLLTCEHWIFIGCEHNLINPILSCSSNPYECFWSHHLNPFLSCSSNPYERFWSHHLNPFLSVQATPMNVSEAITVTPY